MIGLIWAQAANGVIGRNNAIPWRLPEDLAHFRAVTMGTTVVMGRRTWDSLPTRFRPLPGRRNVVLTRDRSWQGSGADTVHDLDAALSDGRTGAVWVIGGAEVYSAALPRADTVVVTELREDVDGDTYAPRLDGDWRLDSSEGWYQSEAGLHYRWCTFHVKFT